MKKPDDQLATARTGSIRSIDLVVQALPPIHDAIGEYTSCIASELARSTSVRILTRSNDEYHSIAHVRIEPCFSMTGRNRLEGLFERLCAVNADVMILQYNPFAWGHRGWAPDLLRVLRRFKRTRPRTCLAIMFHETFPPKSSWPFWVMRCWQVPQYRRLVQLADTSFFSTESWAEDAARQFPNKKVHHLPVGANLPPANCDRSVVRERLDIPADALILGVFGGAHVSRQLDWVGAAADSVSHIVRDRPVVVLHVGGDEEVVRRHFGDVRLVQCGRLESENASNAIGAMDILLNPFTDGISTRRGSVIAGLQNGIAVATTRGHHTERLWDLPEARGVTLVDSDRKDQWIAAVEQLSVDADEQRQNGMLNRALFQKHFAWPVIARNMLDFLSTNSSEE